jgi:hypothetical protein
MNHPSQIYQRDCTKQREGYAQRCQTGHDQKYRTGGTEHQPEAGQYGAQSQRTARW